MDIYKAQYIEVTWSQSPDKLPAYMAMYNLGSAQTSVEMKGIPHIYNKVAHIINFML